MYRVHTVSCRPFQRSAQMQRTYQWLDDDSFAGRKLFVSLLIAFQQVSQCPSTVYEVLSIISLSYTAGRNVRLSLVQMASRGIR